MNVKAYLITNRRDYIGYYIIITTTIKVLFSLGNIIDIIIKANLERSTGKLP